ncbi:MAG: holo-ACP synthase [Acidaminococcaceae bacterium]|nr:holo-ACP synthase [Acidaminococcaceae bacterium]MDO4935128.1 holo-ACP synthase [Phascolarctobacterium sp.]
MVKGVGCDLVTVARMEKAVQQTGFLTRVFTEKEIAYCESRGMQKIASLSARFAAKEAVLKALGTGLRNGKLTDVEVIQDDLGQPGILLHGEIKKIADNKEIKNIQLSLSHEGGQALAMVVMEG